MSDKNNKIYKNAPLFEVVFEIRFPSEPAVESRRDIFFDKIRDKYPHVFVPSIQPGSFPALEAYQYHNDDGSIIIMTAINRLSISIKKYSGFNSFKSLIVDLTKVFNDCYKIKKINRLGIRYINIIPFVRDKGIIPMTEFLNIGFSLPEPISEEFANINLVFTSQLETGSITTKIASLKSNNQNDEALLLDFDYAKDINLDFSKIKNYLEEGHLITKKLFEVFITNEYRTYIKGEVV